MLVEVVNDVVNVLPKVREGADLLVVRVHKLELAALVGFLRLLWIEYKALLCEAHCHLLLLR